MKVILSYKKMFFAGTVICSLGVFLGCSNKDNVKYVTSDDMSSASESQEIKKEDYKNNYQEKYQYY